MLIKTNIRQWRALAILIALKEMACGSTLAERVVSSAAYRKDDWYFSMT